SVHLVCGIWGTLAIGLFANPEAVGYTAGEAGPLTGLFLGGGLTQLGHQFVGGVGAQCAVTVADYRDYLLCHGPPSWVWLETAAAKYRE
ncbi:MAG: ammonium transporter, partial [Chloroflexi bacterium]|nr:ammonium transporter [Chloroflexota bacterium]